mmetsp:Transcript_39756/g.89032  ORF Transcript_39756/g.89032 Transcript_39756/m.89032 type:complete len:221 (-) Transcript_39756:304-966(-)
MSSSMLSAFAFSNRRLGWATSVVRLSTFCLSLWRLLACISFCLRCWRRLLVCTLVSLKLTELHHQVLLWHLDVPQEVRECRNKLSNLHFAVLSLVHCAETHHFLHHLVHSRTSSFALLVNQTMSMVDDLFDLSYVKVTTVVSIHGREEQSHFSGELTAGIAHHVSCTLSHFLDDGVVTSLEHATYSHHPIRKLFLRNAGVFVLIEGLRLCADFCQLRLVC